MTPFFSPQARFTAALQQLYSSFTTALCSRPYTYICPADLPGDSRAGISELSNIWSDRPQMRQIAGTLKNSFDSSR